MNEPVIPTQNDLAWPTLQVLKSSGGSASIPELLEQVTRYLALPGEVSDIPHGEGPQTEAGFRLGWARTRVERVGAIDNTVRGVWRITPVGREIPSEERLRDLIKRPPPTPPPNGPESDWREELLAILRDSCLLARSSGFANAFLGNRALRRSR